MDRYYRILGVSYTASKEEIKRAYHQKMKALHPDKVYGTPLEDTATFFSSEINEAYNIIMSNYNNGYTISNQKDKSKSSEYIEEDIFIDIIGFLKYSLSNNPLIILDAITKRTGYKIDDNINSIEWLLNTGLSENVKNVMNKHDVNYSMTTYVENSIKRVIINKREIDGWYITGYEINTEHQNNEPNTHSSDFNKNKYKSNICNQIRKSNAKTGFFIGILNMLQLIYIYMNKNKIYLPSDDKTTIILLWIIITLILAIKGFLSSRKSYIKEKLNTGYGIVGMVINGIIIVPALLFLLSALIASKNTSRR